MLAGKGSVYALTLAAILCLVEPAFCPAQTDVPSQDAVLPGTPLRGPGQEETTRNDTASCLEPPPLLRWQDYEGPFQKVAGAFAGNLELKSAHPPHYKPGTVLVLTRGERQVHFVRSGYIRSDLIPCRCLRRRFGSGIKPGPAFEQGPEGYGKRFGADFAGQTTWGGSRISPIRQSLRKIPDTAA